MRGCKVEGCARKHKGRGWCKLHYDRWLLHGDPLYNKLVKHMACDTPEYRAWCHMKERCSNPKCKYYYRYGGRGIKVCEAWQDFDNFLADMGKRPTPKHSLDRIDNDGDYEPSNCRWSLQLVQTINRTHNRNNTSGYRGVTWIKQQNKWRSQIMVNGKFRMLGMFNDPQAAHEAYLKEKQEQLSHANIASAL